MRYRYLSVAIPVLAEMENLSELFDMLNRQTINGFSVYICVNNPEGWADSNDAAERAMHLDNQAVLEYLMKTQLSTLDFQLIVLDHSTIGKGWRGRQKGVGWARKVLFDAIAADCDNDELIVSLDADTSFSDTYLESVLCEMNAHPESNAICVPYYHPLCGDEATDRAMLRYEIYMRHYLINLLESGNPYAFTALGSAMVFPLWAYRRVGGITPLQGGEDFYLMQKFVKTGKILLSCKETVMPQGRPSSRVPFGTGPAVAKGIDSMDSTYPLYPYEGFKAVADTYALFPKLYDKDIDTPMSAFLKQQLKTDDLWQPLRKNFKTRELFVHSCTERVDGLRILQYLKTFPIRPAEEELSLFCLKHNVDISTDFSFRTSPISDVEAVRKCLFELENDYRQRLS